MVLKSTTKTKLLLSTLMALTIGVGVVNQHESVVRAEDLNKTLDFTKISNFNDWGNGSYSNHKVLFTTSGTNYGDDHIDEIQPNEEEFGTVTFSASSHQSGTITNCPVSKKGPIEFVIANDFSITGFNLQLTKWSKKTKTVKAEKSSDGGKVYTSTGDSSAEFKLANSSKLNNVNALKFTFTEESNQVGIQSLTIFYTENSKLSLSTDKENLYVGDSTQITANVENANVSDIEWSQSSEDEGKLEIQKNEQGAMVTATHAGNVLVTAKIGSVSATQNIIIKERPYVEVENATHDLGVNDNTTIKIYLRNADFDLSTIQEKDIVFTENDKVVSTEYIGYSADEQCFSYKITALQEGQVTLSLSINYGDYNFEFSFDGEPEQNPLFFNVTNATHYTVQFKYQNELIESVLVEQGSLLTSHPTNPEPKGEDEGKIFDGWYRENGNIWNFEEDKVTEDNLVLNAKFRDKTAEEKVVDLETKANLGFSYNEEAKKKSYAIKKTTDSIDGVLTITKGSSGYVNDNNSGIRLASGKQSGTLTISLDDKNEHFSKILISVKAYDDNPTFKINNIEKTMSKSEESFSIDLTENEITISAEANNRLDITEIVLYSDKDSNEKEYSSFDNVRARFTAHIPDDIYSELDIVRAGVKVTLEGQEEELDIQIEKSKISIGNNEHYFTGSVTQIPLQACKLKMTAQAYIVVNGEKTIMLQAKTMSVDDMVNYYLNNLEDLGLQDQADILKAFQASYANEEI